MTLPNLPEPAMVHMDAQGYSTPCYTSEQMLKLRADTVQACAGVVERESQDSTRFEFADAIRELLI